MKPLLIALVLTLGPAGYAAFSHAAPATTQKTIANKICPVGGHEVDPKVETYDYKGKTIGFCCDECLPEFKKDPEKYMKDLK